MEINIATEKGAHHEQRINTKRHRKDGGRNRIQKVGRAETGLRGRKGSQGPRGSE